jgi:hypothetical protein
MLDPLFAAQPVPANSDFFPYVDLNAPRLRFLTKDAFDLPRLTLLPAPILDMLRADGPTGPTLEPSRLSVLQRDKNVRRALAIRRALTSGKLDDLNASTAAWLRLAVTSGEACTDLAGQNAWTASIQAVSSMTASYLSPTELADVWSRIKETPCYREATSDQRGWADLLAAVAARDTGEIVRLGARLLRQPGGLDKDDLNYLTTVVATALLRRGEAQHARALLAAVWNQLDHSGQLSFSLKELLALALRGDGRAFAQARDTGAGGSGP